MKLSATVMFSMIFAALSCVAQQNYQQIPFPPGKHEITVSTMGGISNLPQLVRSSKLIINGTIDEVLLTARVNPEDPKSVKTYTKVSVNEVLRGELPQGQKNVAIAEIGGKSEGYEIVYTQIPLVQSGERYILFMNPVQEQKGAVVPDLGMPVYSITGDWSGKVKVTEKEEIEIQPAARSAFGRSDDGSKMDPFIAKLKRVIKMVDRPQPKFPQTGTNPPDNTRPSFLIPGQ